MTGLLLTSIKYYMTHTYVSISFLDMSRGLLSIFCDYAIFFIFLILTTIYPLWNDMLGREGKRTKANYVFATGRVSMLPMMFSIARGILGVRALLGEFNTSVE